MRFFQRPAVLLLAASAAICPCVAAQGLGASGLVKRVDRGHDLGSLGTRVSVLFSRSALTSGLELGYTGLPGVETETTLDPGGQVEYHPIRITEKLWHAAFTVRREWINVDGIGGLYAAGGPGLYYLRAKTESWADRSGVTNSSIFTESTAGSFTPGLNVGGGFALRGGPGPGSVDLDVRFHLMPFAGGTGVRSVLTFSAGLSLF